MSGVLRCQIGVLLYCDFSRRVRRHAQVSQKIGLFVSFIGTVGSNSSWRALAMIHPLELRTYLWVVMTPCFEARNSLQCACNYIIMICSVFVITVL